MKNPLILIALFGLIGCTSKQNDENLYSETDTIGIENTTQENPDYSDSSAPANWTRIELNTTLGKLILALNPEQKIHSDNFIKLTKSGFYNGILFHRTVKDFMIQAGDPKSKTATIFDTLGAGGPGYTLTSEIKNTVYHFRGALSAARQSDEINPKRNSSGSQFFIVCGTKIDAPSYKKTLEQTAFNIFKRNPVNRATIEKGNRLYNSGDSAAFFEFEQTVKVKLLSMVDQLFASIPEEIKTRYNYWGGTPNLDNEYTVFGKLISGYGVLDQIQGIPTSKIDRPNKDVRIISARVLP